MEFGTGIQEDLEQAVKWYRSAAESGHAPGQCCLGFCYEAGRGVEQSWEEAVRWYRAAAEQDYPRAQCNLAWCLEYGKGAERDYAAAAELYRAAAERGYPRGQLCMGLCCERGRGVMPNTRLGKVFQRSIQIKKKIPIHACAPFLFVKFYHDSIFPARGNLFGGRTCYHFF